MAARLTSWPLDFRFESSNPGSDSSFLIRKDRYDREKLYAVKRFIDNPQNSQNRPPAKKRTHGSCEYVYIYTCMIDCRLKLISRINWSLQVL